MTPRDREIKNVSMSFENGKFSAILGPNGSSKSLLIDVLGGLYPVSTRTSYYLVHRYYSKHLA
ncbi:ATP-binding cassette domain-containing protein [Arcanobacterium phocae]|uniref:ATP-binding cassette domain-containing protein n=1 Tax=Arcanobacterium phocae TaxID=131112 RepID=UPI0038B3C6D4